MAFIASDLILIKITQIQSIKNYKSVVSDLQEQNRVLQTKLNEFELSSSKLETQNKQLKSEMDDFMQLQTSEDKDQKSAAQLKEALAQKEKEYNKLKEENTLLNSAYTDLMKEGLATPTQQQSEDTGRRQRPTQEQMDQMRTSMMERTSQTLDSRIAEAKTEYEAGLLTNIKQAYDDMYQLQEKSRTAATEEERAALRDQMNQQRRALGQLSQDYNTYQWQSLSKEFGITNTDEFIKRAQELSQTNSPFSFFGGRTGQQGRPPGTSQEQPPQ